MDPKAKLNDLIRLAGEALNVKLDADVMPFVEKTDLYLTELEQWQEMVKTEDPFGAAAGLSEPAKTEIRELVAKLSELHQTLMKAASESRDEVGSKMKDVHRRASGLRKYVDKLPSRISIAGKRKG